MQELKKILEEVEEIGNIQFASYTKPLIAVEDVIKIIRKHMNDGWIPCEEPPEIDCRTILIQLKNEGIMEGLYNGSEFVGIDRMGVYQFLENNPPVYWRRKPEPYRPGESGEKEREQMSDDLISRKAAIELVIAEYDRFQANGGSHSGRNELDKAIKMLQNMPTAFDKEKVINIIASANSHITMGNKMQALAYMAELERIVEEV